MKRNIIFVGDFQGMWTRLDINNLPFFRTSLLL